MIDNMHHSSIIKMKPSIKMADQIDSNPKLLLMLQHFNIDFRVSDLTVSQLCQQYNISESLFVDIANFTTVLGLEKSYLHKKDLLQVIDFLKTLTTTIAQICIRK